ncbi:MAG: sugar ABC transporter ATP-binding protein [Propionibacteriaceae bacterium]|nr:sugar ABC transporter ATP-binding protein [Propionibacteriaceae bacterium]
MSAALLEVRGLRKAFFATQAVQDVSFDVHAGEVVALMGENGAGKSTVIKMLAGVYKPDAGTMRVLGRPIDEVRAKDVSFIHQTLGLIEWMTVAENIALGMGFPKRGPFIDWKAANEQAERVLDLVGGGVDPQTRVFDLPRTERSLLAIARALVGDPKLLVLDEPTASLPHHDVERLFEVLRRLKDGGTGMIYVSHRLDEIYAIADRAVILRNGVKVGDRIVKDLPHKELVNLIVGKETFAVKFAKPRDEVRLKLAGLRVGEVGPIDLSVRAGEIVGLCGLRGAGQGPAGRAIAGVDRVTGGTMELNGEPVSFRSVRDAIGHRIAFVTSNREAESLAPGMPVRENLFLNPSLWGFQWFQPNLMAPERARATEITSAYSVSPPDPELAADTLSGGNQQKVVLARWLSLDYDLVVLEEPTMGVDVGAKAEIYQLLRQAADAGTAIVVVTTDLEEATAICHRAIVFERGRPRTEVDAEHLSIATLMAAASGLATPDTSSGK